MSEIYAGFDTGLIVRPMQVEDLDWVSDSESDICAFPWSRLNFSDSLSAGYSCWMLTRGDCSVGYVIMMMVADEAHILTIGVAQAFQGKGFGARLLQYLFGVAKTQGAVQMFLEVRPSNQSALSLYLKSGFVQIGRRKGYYPARNGREDALVLRRDL